MAHVANLKRIFTLRFTVVIEVLYALIPNLYKRYIRRWEYIPIAEWGYLNKNFNCSVFKKIIVVGGGSIPFTAIYLNKILNQKNFVIIERNKISALAARILLERLGYNNFKVINISAQDYSDYDSSIIIIALQVTQKQKIVNRILNDYRDTILIIRQPIGSNLQLFDYVSLNKIQYSAIKQDPSFESIFLARVS